MKRQLMLSCGFCAIAVASSANARPLSAFWQEVPIVDDGGDASDLTGFRSFDLFIQLEIGDFVYAADSGFAGPNTGLSLGAGQDFFLHEFGADTPRSPLMIDLFPDLEFDTRFQLGSLAFDEMQSLVTADWDPTGVMGVINTLLVDGQSPIEALPNASGEFWAGRFTVSSVGAFEQNTAGLGEFLGGQFFLTGEGTNGEFGMFIPSTGTVDIPNAFIPTPGAIALLSGFLLIPGRRQRAK